MTRFIKITLLTVTVLLVCLGIYLLMTKQKTIEIGENHDTKEYEPDTSFIYMPVTLSLNGLLTGINTRLPKTLVDKSVSVGSGSIKLIITRNGDISSGLDSNLLKLKMPFKIQIKYESSSSDNAFLKLLSSVPVNFDQVVEMALPIGINQDLNLTGIKEGMDINWQPLPEIDLPATDFNLQSILEKELFSEGGILYDYLIGELLEKFSLNEYVSDAWKHFQLEIPVSSLEDGFLLRSEPVSLTAWYTGGKSDSLIVGLKIGSKFFVKHKSELKNMPIISLPDNIAIENKGYFKDTSTFSVKVSLPLVVMNELSLKYLREADLSYKGFKVQIDKVKFTNGKNTVYVKINYSGNIKGTLILKGTPFVDPVTRVFTLKNLGLQTQSTNLLVTSADRLLNEFLVSKMQNAIYFDLGKAVDSLPVMFSSKLTDLSFNQGVETKVQQLKLENVETHLTKDKIQLIVNGRSKFYVTPRHYNFDFSGLGK